MAAFESVLTPANMRAALRQLHRRASGGAWRRGYSSATRQENELEVGESSSGSAPKLISQKVGDTTMHTELRLLLQPYYKHRPGAVCLLGNHSCVLANLRDSPIISRSAYRYYALTNTGSQ